MNFLIINTARIPQPIAETKWRREKHSGNTKMLYPLSYLKPKQKNYNHIKLFYSNIQLYNKLP